MRREDAVRLGWNGQNPRIRERMWAEAIHPEELERIRSSIRVGDKQSWKIDAWEEREGNEHVWKKITVRITGKYRHLVTAIDQNRVRASVRRVQEGWEVDVQKFRGLPGSN